MNNKGGFLGIVFLHLILLLVFFFTLMLIGNPTGVPIGFGFEIPTFVFGIGLIVLGFIFGFNTILLILGFGLLLHWGIFSGFIEALMVVE